MTDPYDGVGAAGQVYRVDTATGNLSGTFAPAAGATELSFIARGPDGRMWVADFDPTLMRAGSDGVFEKPPANGDPHNGLAVGGRRRPPRGTPPWTFLVSLRLRQSP